jgi:regulator of protease activity HflC (stomatin/prohibitin superfamily)
VSFVTVLRSLSALSWLVLIGLIIYTVVRASPDRNSKGSVPMIVIVLVVALALNVLSAGLIFIEPTERGVVISAVPGQQGIRQDALLPGLNWIVPYFDKVITYPISRQTYTMSIAAGEGQIQGDDSVETRTSDGQIVWVDASVIHAIDPAKVVDVHIAWQNKYEDGLVRPLSRGIIRDVFSSFGVEEVCSNQQLIIDEISSELEKKLEEEGIFLIDFVLRDIAFSEGTCQD